MTYSRRDILKIGAAAGLASTAPSNLFAQSNSAVPLTAREASLQLAPPDYPQTAIWGFDGSMPGPVIRVRQGGRVTRRLVNELPQATSLHWHGVRIDNAMDGVGGLTQEAVAPAASFDIDFTAPDAGTYWYHAHNRSVEQVARGLYGALVVEEPEGPDVDRDEVLILDDWLLNPDTAQIDPDFKQDLRLGITGTIGDKLRVDVNWDTNNQFDFQNQLKLEYTGYEDEIIQKIEAGNVFLQTPSTLIRGGQSLFGIKSEMQLGGPGIWPVRKVL